MRNMYRALIAVAAGIAAPQAAHAQLYLAQPDFRPGPIEGSDPLVGIPIPGATAAEYRATLLWNLRAGLNVAALQCQFSNYLRAVPNYNGLLAHHSVELAAAYTTLGNYFKRVHGARGQKLFDDFSTATYNNFSTLQAQYGFCQAASSITKAALATPKGELYQLAQRRVRELRNSLIPVTDRTEMAYNPFAIRLSPLPPYRADCWNKKNQLVAKCANLTM
ncbi:MAG TPA: hypothetical protein VIT45_11040 [Allosphingosinicella sp.]